MESSGRSIGLLRALLVLPLTAILLFGCSAGEEDKPDLSGLLALLGSRAPRPDSASCPSGWPFASGAYLADQVSEAPGFTGSGFGDARRATDGVCGGGTGAGSLDVYTLASSGTSTLCAAGKQCMVLSWSGGNAQNVAGIDFVVYENAFGIMAGQNLIEPVVVEVSSDGSTWCGFAPTYSGDSSNASLQNPANYTNVAGVTPVFFNQSTWTEAASGLFVSVPADATYGLTHLKGGGDGFDLDGLVVDAGCDAAGAAAIQSPTGGFRYVRLTSGASVGMSITTNSFDQSPDIDGVVARQVQ